MPRRSSSFKRVAAALEAPPPRRWTIALGVAVSSAVIVVALFQFAAHAVRGKLLAALPPNTTIEDVSIGLRAIDIRGLVIPGRAGWPAAEEVHAQRIRVVPDLRALFSARLRIASIDVDNVYLSVLRARDGVRLLPTLLDMHRHADARATPGAPSTPMSIGRITVHAGAIDFFDASIRTPAWKQRLEAMSLTLDDLRVPALDAQSRVDLHATVKGVRRNGTLDIRGWLQFATRDAALEWRLHDVDLLALQPYLIKSADAAVRSGSLDMQLRSTVDRMHLHAPGRIVLTHLELASDGGFMGVPRALVLRALKDKGDRIDVGFTLEGRLDDPKFSLNEDLNLRVAAAVGEAAGVSLGGLVRGVGDVGQKGFGAVGDAVRGLFGNR